MLAYRGFATKNNVKLLDIYVVFHILIVADKRLTLQEIADIRLP
jgi:hypothetical protein